MSGFKAIIASMTITLVLGIVAVGATVKLRLDQAAAERANPSYTDFQCFSQGTLIYQGSALSRNVWFRKNMWHFLEDETGTEIALSGDCRVQVRRASQDPFFEHRLDPLGSQPQ